MTSFRGDERQSGYYGNVSPGKAVVRRWAVPASWGDYPGVVVTDGAVWGVPVGLELQVRALEDGAPKWRTPIGKREAVFVPELTADLVLFGTSSRKLCAADRATGAVRWTAPLDVLGHVHPVVIGDSVVVRNRKPDRLVCLDLATGAERWSRDLPAARFMTDHAQTLFVDGAVVLCDSEGVKWFDPATGKPGRRVDVPRLESLFVEGDSFVALSTQPFVTLVPRAEGGSLRRIALPKTGGFHRYSACCGGRLHGANADYQVRFSVDLAGGEVAIHESGVSGFGGFAAAGDEVYAVQSAKLRAFDAKTGAERWSVTTDPAITEPGFASAIPHAGGIVVVSAAAVHSYAWE